MSPSVASGLRILIAGGGTGGHVFPALAIQAAIARIQPHATFLFVGTEHGLESRVMPANGLKLETIWIAGFARKRILSNLSLPFKLLVSIWQSVLILRRYRPHVAIGSGGYVMGPILWASRLLGIPTLIQEQNSLPGVTTRKLARHASAICLGYEDAKKHLDTEKIHVTGNPVRAQLLAATVGAAGKTKWNLLADRPTLLVFGGSLGARSLNMAVADILIDLLKSWNLIWQTGKSGVPDHASKSLMREAVASRKLVVLEFIENMPEAYASAELAVCRAGAMTLAELAIAGLPAVLVPFPHAADDHQSANAKSVEHAGAAIVVADHELSGMKLMSLLGQLKSDHETLDSMRVAMKSLARPNAADEIAQIALALAATP